MPISAKKTWDLILFQGVKRFKRHIHEVFGSWRDALFREGFGLGAACLFYFPFVLHAATPLGSLTLAACSAEIMGVTCDVDGSCQVIPDG